MANSRINKLLRRPIPLPPRVQHALRQMEELAAQYPDLLSLANTTTALLRCMYGDLPVLPISFTAQEAAAGLEDGRPLLRHVALPLDGPWLQKQFGQLAAVMVAARHTAAAELIDAARTGRLDVRQLVQATLQGDPAAVATAADDLALDAALVGTLLRMTLFPLLEPVSAEARAVRPEEIWKQGYCPTCGAWPLLGEYRGLEQQRWLRCGLCADEWRADRLMCFACGSREYGDLHYLQVADDEQHRIHTCDRCHSYIKQIATLDRLDGPALLVADVATIHLDLIAMDWAKGQA